MFSIYDYDGRIFRNTLEELYKVNPIGESQAALQSKAEMLKQRSDLPTAAKTIPNSSALKAYKELIHANPKEELHHAYEIMQEDFHVLREEQTVYDALQIILDGQQDIMPVVNSHNRIVGLFSYRQIIEMLMDDGKQAPNLKVMPIKTFIRDKVITAEPITSIRRIAVVMSQYHLSMVPIVDAYDAMVGVITLQEISKAIANDPPISVWT